MEYIIDTFFHTILGKSILLKNQNWVSIDEKWLLSSKCLHIQFYHTVSTQVYVENKSVQSLNHWNALIDVYFVNNKQYKFILFWLM